MSPAVLDAWVAVGEATRGRERRQRCAMRGEPAGQRGSPGPARPPEVGIEHAMGPKSSRGECGHGRLGDVATPFPEDRKSTRLNSSHVAISYAVFCLKKKKQKKTIQRTQDTIE